MPIASLSSACALSIIARPNASLPVVPAGPAVFGWYDLSDAASRLDSTGTSVTANGAQIFQIRDKSGNAFHLTNVGGLGAGASNRNILCTTYAYGPVLDTSGTSNGGAANTQAHTGFRTTAGTGTTPLFTAGITVFAVFAPFGTGASGYGAIFVKNQSVNSWPMQTYQTTRARGADNNNFLNPNYNMNTGQCTTPALTSNAGLGVLAKRPTLMTSSWGAPNATTYNEYINGTNSFTATWGTLPIWGDTVASPFYLSTRGNLETWSFTHFAEVLLYNNDPSTLSAAFSRKVEGYLAWKWGMQTFLPTGHPYRNAGPPGFNPTTGV